jgi:hypothetical protein
MEDKKIWVYIGKGGFLDGIPARDLYAADVARLDNDQIIAVEGSPLYRRAPRVEESEPESAVEPQSEPGVEIKTLKGAKGAREAKE